MLRNRECGPKQQKFSSRISTNYVVKTKKKVFISKNARIFTISGVEPRKKYLYCKICKKKQFLLTNSRVTTNILRVSGLKLHFRGTELVTFLGHNPRLGGHDSRLGGHCLGMPPRGARPGEVLFLVFSYTQKKTIN